MPLQPQISQKQNKCKKFHIAKLLFLVLLLLLELPQPGRRYLMAVGELYISWRKFREAPIPVSKVCSSDDKRRSGAANIAIGRGRLSVPTGWTDEERNEIPLDKWLVLVLAWATVAGLLVAGDVQMR